MKNNFHLHNQMHMDPSNGGQQERDNSVGLPYRQNMRGGHSKMPSLPSNIKGSIGSVSGAANGSRAVPNDPQLIGSDIPFNHEYKAKYRNFAG